MEKGPEIRIVGGVSAEKKEQTRKEVEQALFSHFKSLSPQEREQFEKFEYMKSEKEVALIDFANEETLRLMQEAGVEPYDVPIENYHIIPSELYKKAAGDSGTATTFNTKQGIIFDAQHFRDNPVNFGAVDLHESLHLKAHFSMEVKEEGEKIESPEDDIIWVDKKNKNDWETVPYLQQRDVLNYVCAEIQKQFPDEYKSADDVYKTFLNAHFTGRLLPLARLVEETFGEGSFRLLGNMDTDRQSGILHLESLKKARARQTREKTIF